MPRLSDGGLLALRVLARTDRFTDLGIGAGLERPVEVDAMRVLFREPEADAAFKFLLGRETRREWRSTREGRMFALCGLWYTDPDAFRGEAERLLEEEGGGGVRTFFGCLMSEDTTVADLVRHPGDDPVARLKDRRQSIREWREETEVEGAAYDIEGGPTRGCSATAETDSQAGSRASPSAFAAALRRASAEPKRSATEEDRATSMALASWRASRLRNGCLPTIAAARRRTESSRGTRWKSGSSSRNDARMERASPIRIDPWRTRRATAEAISTRARSDTTTRRPPSAMAASGGPSGVSLQYLRRSRLVSR